MTTEKLVSVVLPTHNRAATLERAIRSVLAQTYDNLELIVVDDASSDLTQNILDRFTDRRLKIIRNQVRQGVSMARNTGVLQATGEYIAFQDSDDEWRVQKLQMQLAAMREETILVLCGNWFVNAPLMGFTLRSCALGRTIDVTEQVVVRIPGAPCFLMRRADFLSVGGFDTAMNCFEDWELALRLSLKGRVVLVNEPLVICQRTQGGLFSAEAGYITNLQRIFEKHGTRIKASTVARNKYCNLLGQTLCMYGDCKGGRRYFLEALQGRIVSFRTWGNIIASYLGSAFFGAYVRRARWLRERLVQIAPLESILG
jgi:glycosyltransferase involved in cell wall biosynthesis